MRRPPPALKLTVFAVMAISAGLICHAVSDAQFIYTNNTCDNVACPGTCMGLNGDLFPVQCTITPNQLYLACTPNDNYDCGQTSDVFFCRGTYLAGDPPFQTQQPCYCGQYKCNVTYPH